MFSRALARYMPWLLLLGMDRKKPCRCSLIMVPIPMASKWKEEER
jgi:hypothetical protein